MANDNVPQRHHPRASDEEIVKNIPSYSGYTPTSKENAAIERHLSRKMMQHHSMKEHELPYWKS